MGVFKKFLTDHQLQEGVYDPNIFNAIFLAGGPGSGKSYVVKKTTGGLGMKIVNSDDIYEKDLEKAGLDIGKPDDIDSDQGQAIRLRSKEKTIARRSLWVDGRLGIIIDGTGKDVAKITNQKKLLDLLGYQCAMIFVNSSLDVAQQRNKDRPRSLSTKRVERMWNDVQKNMGAFQSSFGSKHFIIVDNNDAGEDIFNEVYKRIRGLVTKKPTKIQAKQWIAKELKKKNKKGHFFKAANEEMSNHGLEEAYGVFSKGGSIGQKTSDVPVRVFDDKNEAKEFAARLRKQLSPGEKKYYKMSYVIKAVKDMKEGLDERDYRKEYDNYQGSPEQIARRSSRNKARRVMGDDCEEGQDVGHKDNNPMNNDRANLRNEDPSKNRREPRLRKEADLTVTRLPRWRTLLKQYKKNEDRNAHSENYLLLAKAFGTPKQVKEVEAILKRNKKQGHTSEKDNKWMYKNINPYYKELVSAAKNESFSGYREAIEERKLTDKELKRREEIAKNLDDEDLKKRYGDDWKAVKMGIATNMAKKESLNEARQKVVVYDNDGKTFDRYTVFITYATGETFAFGMSVNPKVITSGPLVGQEYPNGFNQFVGEVPREISPGKHQGKKLSRIPKEIEKAVKVRMKESVNEATIGKAGIGFFIDQLTNAMDHYNEREFVSHLNKELKIDKKVLKGVWKNYLKVSPRDQTKWSSQIWKGWLEQQGIVESVEDIKEAYKYKTDHKTYTSAVEEALLVAEKAKYEVDMDDYFDQIATGPRKPGEGKTNRFEIVLTKGGQEQRKKLHIQIYGKGKHGYELNCYIS